MVCSLCQTPNTTKTTCPLYIKNPNKTHWEKHYLAKKSKPKITNHPNPTITNRSTPKIMRDKSYRNTYKDTLLRIKSIISIFKIRLKRNHYKLSISGLELKSLNIVISNAEKFSIDLKV